jgi:hypothetical protein
MCSNEEEFMLRGIGPCKRYKPDGKDYDLNEEPDFAPSAEIIKQLKEALANKRKKALFGYGLLIAPHP